ncbi:MAG: hypothetical protein KKE83_03930 [Proteobacteria bacterium]|nr:hypothetical protein [Pseudomonadota bacterium]MBU1545683.1 hypothetical protein [Pseudomonadota bacterium]MBU2618814.1 hypothetical protein [Pseudomonadota bacterium]
MKANISHLRELQAIDQKISTLDKEIAASAAEIDSRRASLVGHRETIDLLTAKIAACEEQRRELEAELEDEQVRIKDRQAKLMNVQTNREYQSILKETEDGKKNNTQREETMVQLMEQIETLKTKIEEESKICEEDEKMLAEDIAAVEKKTSQFTAEKSKILKNRESKASAVTASLLKKYTSIRDKRNGLAIVPVTGGVCRGCFMNIPPQLYNDLMKEDKLISCPTCHRIMFHQTETEEA